jgi:multiple sugar transport system substrate-binding protein
MERLAPVILAAMLMVAPFGARSADLVVWWQKGFYAQEDEAIAEIVTAFEEGNGKRVDLVLHELADFPGAIEAALETGQPPDFAFGTLIGSYFGQWAAFDRLVDLTDVVGQFSALFDPDALSAATWLNGSTGRRALYALPMGRTTNHVHVWKNLLEQAGFTLEDIPKDWDAFWSFWCNEVQPAVRRATGRDEIWAIGLNMSGGVGLATTTAGFDTQDQFFQFVAAYEADYVTRDGRLLIDDPAIRRKLIEAIDAYTAVYRAGCTPPSSIGWDANRDNNEQFLTQSVVMTPNATLAIPNRLKREHPEDYENSVSIEWPLGPDGKAFPIREMFYAAAVFRHGRNLGAAKEFVRFLVAEGWLAHYLDFARERMLPPMPKLREAPFWLDSSDRHRVVAEMQIASRSHAYNYATVSGNWRHDLVERELVWPRAIHRIVTEGISPEQAVDEAIARIKEILAE